MRWRALYLHSPLGLAPIGTRGLRHRECPSQEKEEEDSCKRACALDLPRITQV